MDSHTALQKRNFRYHLIEGSVYLATGALLNAQTVFPALVKKMGGSDYVIGLLPLIFYAGYFLPQLFGANYSCRYPYRKPWILLNGLLQRLQILVLFFVVIVFGSWLPEFGLVVFFIVLTLNQIFGGFAAPAWFDYVAKTVAPGQSGKLMGFRTSFGATLGFLNSLILTGLLLYFEYPLNYSLAFLIAFVYQMISWLILRKTVELGPSEVGARVRTMKLLSHSYDIVVKDQLFKRFLIASAVSTIGLMPVGFFAVASLAKFHLDETAIGFYTMISVGAQIISAGALGWLGDVKGYKVSLLICSAAMVFATSFAIFAPSPGWYYLVFALTGVTLGAEMITRFNFAVECAPAAQRARYIGLMNAWFAPFYLSSLLGGAISAAIGYETMFIVGLLFSTFGFFLLLRIREPRRKTG